MSCLKPNLIAHLSQVLDFGAARDGVPTEKRGRRIVVDGNGEEVPEDSIIDLVDIDEIT